MVPPHRSLRNKSDHLLTGLLFDDAGHRMIPTHATKAGVRYRYYASTPFLHGEAKTASAGSVSRVPAADIEDTVVKSLKEHLAAEQDHAKTNAMRLGIRDVLTAARRRDCRAQGQAGRSIQIRSRGRSIRLPGRSVAHNSLAKAAIQKSPPDPAPAQRISKRRPSGAV